MLGSINRRFFFKTLILASLAPEVLAKTSKAYTFSTAHDHLDFKNITYIDNQFVSVDGWVLPIKALTAGVNYYAFRL